MGLAGSSCRAAISSSAWWASGISEARLWSVTSKVSKIAARSCHSRLGLLRLNGRRTHPLGLRQVDKNFLCASLDGGQNLHLQYIGHRAINTTGHHEFPVVAL